MAPRGAGGTDCAPGRQPVHGAERRRSRTDPRRLRGPRLVDEPARDLPCPHAPAGAAARTGESMNQVLLHLGKDVRHFRAALGLWLLVVAGQTALVGLGPRLLAVNAVFPEVLGLLSILRRLLACVLVALAVKDEPLVGRTA